ncbi:type B 50S ribosomal protein L31 [Streptomyces sp. JNUCC 64]
MKPGSHPAHGPVVLRDPDSGTALPVRSAVTGEKAAEREDGRFRPGAGGETSARGATRVTRAAGRVERFQRRYGSR